VVANDFTSVAVDVETRQPIWFVLRSCEQR